MNAAPLVIGGLYILHDGSPWPPTGAPVRITDMKEGWVRYSYESGSDHRCTENTFRSIFVPYESLRSVA